jgi:prepilin-type N-terminal cleavage/methylation domain-containing protein
VVYLNKAVKSSLPHLGRAINPRRYSVTSRVDSTNGMVSRRGFSLIELMFAVTVILIIIALASPAMMQVLYSVRLRARASDLSDLHQRARILAAKNNATYAIRYGNDANTGLPIAFIDVDQNGVLDVINDPVMYFTGTVTPAAGAPNGVGGVPNYVLVGDTGPGAWDNTMLLAYGPRGLPCAYNAAPTCATPAIQYFVYYLRDTRPGGRWAAVVVTKSGRSKVVVWNGATWN